MFSFRGDAHKFFLKLKRLKSLKQEIDHIKEMNEISEIIRFYQDLPNSVLKKIKLKMIKEKQASGSIPLIVTTVPWLLFIFSKPLLELLFGAFNLWIPFVIIYIILLFWGIYLHFHEKAWASLHIEVIEDVLQDRKQ
ncbi:hypothetical protein ACFSCX_13165 [Bacillus salitolerans]|uniref:DUF106 domain-containing protein n=1 Tax=Bacillus salitolerans TaxID=1437434 RepID=A0ABW4LQR9_9BACI